MECLNCHVRAPAKVHATRAVDPTQQTRVFGPACVSLHGSRAASVFAGSTSRSLCERAPVISGSRHTRAVKPGGAIAAAAVPSFEEERRNIAALRFWELFAAVEKKSPVGEEGRENRAPFRISRTFASLKQSSKVAFIPYLTAGDPNLETTAAAATILQRCGADIIELGVPYSDPLADGPVLQAAANRAIRGGTNLDSVLTLLREGMAHINVPIVLFVYYNPLLKRGLEKFIAELKAAGASGLVVPDLPIEQTGKLRDLTAAAGLELVLLTTPTTPTTRMTAITEASQGFIYLVSLTGVTGTRATIQDRVEGLLKDIKKVSDKPVAVGFGVSTAEQAIKLAEWGADGVIIGSAIVKLLGESGSPEAGLIAVEDFANKVRDALPGVYPPPFPLE